MKTSEALDFGLGHERRDRVDDNDVNRIGAHEHLGDLQRLLAGVGLGDQEVVEVHAELLRVGGVERVLGVDEGGRALALLALRDDAQGERRLAAAFGPEDLDHAAARDASHTEGHVERNGARGDGRHVVLDVLAEHHDGALAELFFDLLYGGFNRLFLFGDIDLFFFFLFFSVFGFFDFDHETSDLRFSNFPYRSDLETFS